MDGGSNSMRRCPRCREVKALTEFTVNRGKPGGHGWYCLPCNREFQSAWRKSEAGRASNRRSQQAYVARNREKVVEFRRAWRHRNPDKVRAMEARYKERHPEKVKAKDDRHNENRQYKFRYPVYERDRGICHICKKKVPREAFTVDHLIPVSAGGLTTFENLAVAHPSCNYRRGPGLIPAQLRLIG